MADQVVLGFDFGTTLIGVAVGNQIANTARPLTAVGGGDPPNWPAIDELVAEWRPTRLLVGLPLNDNADDPGAEQPMTRRARRFMRQLGERFLIAVEAVDERFTTSEAVDRLRGARASGSRKRRVAKGDRDAAAAAVIVEAWFAQPEVSDPI